MRRGISRPLVLLAAVGVAVGAWAVAGYRILSVPSADLAQFERSVFSPAGQDGVLERIFEVIEPRHRYLVDLGVSSSKLRTVSYGEARPAVPGHDESAWSQNRRGVTVVNSVGS